jgi:hypothetical protein
MTGYNADKIGPPYIDRFQGGLANTEMVLASIKALYPKTKSRLKPEKRVDIFLKRLKKIEKGLSDSNISQEVHDVRKQKLDLLIENFISAIVIKKENFPESYFRKQLKIAGKKGYGNLRWTKDAREKEVARIQDEQKADLKMWSDYLISDGAKVAYPLWFRFYVFLSISKLRPINKVMRTYPRRDKTTIDTFPLLNREVLAKVYAYVNMSAELQFEEKGIDGLPEGMCELEKGKIENQKRSLDIFGRLAYQGRFGKLCFEIMDRQRIQERAAVRRRGESTIEGEWATFERGSSPEELVTVLRGKGTGWCIAGSVVARNYLNEGSMYVYFTRDKEDYFSIPRILIRTGNNSVIEVCGIRKGQKLEPDLVGIAREKYMGLPGGDKYDKVVYRLAARGHRLLRRKLAGSFIFPRNRSVPSS